jgi:hypothetical protein
MPPGRSPLPALNRLQRGARHPGGKDRGEAAATAAAERPRDQRAPAAVETAHAPGADLPPKHPDSVSRFMPSVSDASTAA